MKLVSWKNADDPGRGSYSLEMDSNGGELLMKKNGSESIIWRSGGWRDGGFASLPNSSSLYTFSRSSRNGASFFTYVVRSESIKVRIMLHSSGILYQYIWSEARGDWFALAVEPSDPKFCSTYENCGANTICDVNYAPACRCLDGFGPRVSRDWDLFDFSNGCVRDRGLRCENDQKTAFANVSYATWRGSPESRNVSNNAECESFCSADCSCSAYSIGNSSGGGGGGGCLLFRGELIGLERLKNASMGDDIYVRMESSERKGARVSSSILCINHVLFLHVISDDCVFMCDRKEKSSCCGFSCAFDCCSCFLSLLLLSVAKVQKQRYNTTLISS